MGRNGPEPPGDEWERRAAELWAAFDDHAEAEFLALMDELTAQLPAGHPVALFERASARDAVGQEAQAVALYRQALDAGLAQGRRRQAVIQLASSLRVLGDAAGSVAMLRAEKTAAADELDDAVSAFLALSLVDAGAAREAVSVALAALAPHLASYQRSVTSYARELLDPAPAPGGGG